MKRTPFNVAKLILPALILVTMSSGCFKKGSGKGARQNKPDLNTTGDIFVPGPGSKPGVPKTDDPVTGMDPQARAILASCFGIPEEEVQDVVGWTDSAAAVSAANALCTQLTSVGYNQGTVNPTAAAVEIK